MCHYAQFFAYTLIRPKSPLKYRQSGSIPTPQYLQTPYYEIISLSMVYTLVEGAFLNGGYTLLQLTCFEPEHSMFYLKMPVNR